MAASPQLPQALAPPLRPLAVGSAPTSSLAGYLARAAPDSLGLARSNNSRLVALVLGPHGARRPHSAASPRLSCLAAGSPRQHLAPPAFPRNLPPRLAPLAGCSPLAPSALAPLQVWHFRPGFHARLWAAVRKLLARRAAVVPPIALWRGVYRPLPARLWTAECWRTAARQTLLRIPRLWAAELRGFWRHEPRRGGPLRAAELRPLLPGFFRRGTVLRWRAAARRGVHSAAGARLPHSCRPRALLPHHPANSGRQHLRQPP